MKKANPKVLSLLTRHERKISCCVGLRDKYSEQLQIYSHDVKAPLTSLLAAADSLLTVLGKDLTSSQQKIVETIYRQGRVISEMTSELLDNFHFEENMEKLNLVHENLEKIIDGCLEDMSYLALRKRSRIKKNIKAKGIKVVLDDEKFARALKNLLGNAIKFSPMESVITVIAEMRRSPGDQPFVVIKIQDQGPGIRREKFPLLFKKYEKGLHEGSEQAGTGLGLYIASKIIAAHQGRIEVESELGKGSAFLIFLPLLQEMQRSINS